MEILKRQQYCQYSWRVDVKDAGGDRVTVKVRTMLLVTGVLMGVTEATVEVGDGDSDRDIPSVMLASFRGIMACTVHRPESKVTLWSPASFLYR